VKFPAVPFFLEYWPKTAQHQKSATLYEKKSYDLASVLVRMIVIALIEKDSHQGVEERGSRYGENTPPGYRNSTELPDWSFAGNTTRF
jgi:hypothetical protein